MEPTATNHGRRNTMVAIVVLQVLQILSLAPWLMMAALSFMVFDSPGSDKMWQTWTFVIAMWSYPVWLIAAGLVAWILFAKRRFAWALVIESIFTLPAFLLIGWMLLMVIVNRFS